MPHTGRRLSVATITKHTLRFIGIGLVLALGVATFLSGRAVTTEMAIEEVEHPDLAWYQRHATSDLVVRDVGRCRLPGVTVEGYTTLWGQGRNQFTVLFAYRYFAGWPMRCLTGGYVKDLADDPNKPWGRTERVHTISCIVFESWPDTSGSTRDVVLPYRPLLAGLVVNTLFYATTTFIGWQLLLLPGRIKRRIRIGRNTCAHCGYPIGTSSRCTECGAEVTLTTPSRSA